MEQPRVYDATYAALAEAFGCDFWTVDEKFFKAANAPAPYAPAPKAPALKAPGRKAAKVPRLPLVKFIGDY